MRSFGGLQEDMLDVTRIHLRDLHASPSETAAKLRRYARKSAAAPLTRTEQMVMTRIGDEFALGYVSTPLCFSREFRRWTLLERRAMLSLLDRGRLALYLVNDRDDFIIRQQGRASDA